MANQLLISISATQISAARWQGGGFTACEKFTAGEDGLGAFKEYLVQTRDMPVQMIVDAVEEDYRVESLPHSFGSDRTEMVSRKLKQHYRNAVYTSARQQGRDAGKRHDDRYLFCALTNAELIEPWVQAVVERGLPIAGIYLLPTVSQRLIEKLHLKQTNLLAVSIHSAGTRLTFFRDQRLRVSRLARIDLAGPAAIKGYAEEISNTRLYLHAVRVMTLDEPLSVLIIDPDDTLTELEQAVARDNPTIDCRRLSRKDIISAIGISEAALNSSTGALYLHLLGLRAPDSNLAPANITAGYRRHQTRRGVYALTAVSALAAATWCAVNLYQILDAKGEAGAAQRQAADLQIQYQEVTRTFPAAPTTAENLKRAVEISQKIGSLTRTPELMMDLISKALERHPTITLRVMGWKYGTGEIDPDPGKSSKPAADSGAPGGAAKDRVQSGIVEGEVRPFRGDYRSAIDAINRFADSLSQMPQVNEVRVIKLPLNISPDLSLSGNTTDSRDQAGKAEFKLVLTLRPTI